MPFGLATNPSAFSRFVHKTIKNMNWSGIIFYIDDVIVYARILKKLLMRCREAQLTLNLRKCEVLKTSLLYLGYAVSSKGLRANPKKVEIVKNHPTPKTKKQLQSFLGLMNYYRWFI